MSVNLNSFRFSGLDWIRVSYHSYLLQILQAIFCQSRRKLEMTMLHKLNHKNKTTTSIDRLKRFFLANGAFIEINLNLIQLHEQPSWNDYYSDDCDKLKTEWICVWSLGPGLAFVFGIKTFSIYNVYMCEWRENRKLFFFRLSVGNRLQLLCDCSWFFHIYTKFVLITGWNGSMRFCMTNIN